MKFKTYEGQRELKKKKKEKAAAACLLPRKLADLQDLELRQTPEI